MLNTCGEPMLPMLVTWQSRRRAVVGLRGPLDIDIRRRTDGLPVVLEINARFGANIRFASEVLDTALLPYIHAQ